MKVVCIGNSIVKGFPHSQSQSFPSVLIRKAADRKGCALVDLGLKYKRFGKYHDGLHPTVEGQEWIANCIIEELIQEKNHATRE